MTWTQIAAVWFIASVIASPFVGECLHYLHNRRVNRELKVLLDRERDAREHKLSLSDVVLPHNPMKYEMRDLTPEQKAFALDDTSIPRKSA